MIGRTVGKYRIVSQLGRGGSGIVYKAIDETLQRDVAIKTLNPDLANTEVMKRFRTEATTLARLNHPQIATIFELYHDDADLLMVMEFVRGETIDRLASRLGPMTPEAAVYLVDQMLSALEHAHRAGIVHRDMKPANVMVTETGAVKIMDFGIARVRGAEQMTIDGRLMGTPAYMPPEQVLGQEVDGRADLYAVGVVFYRLLSGTLPFTADTALAMLQRQILETPTPLRTHRPGLPEWCERVVERALAKSADDRFQTAEEFREAVLSAVGPLPSAELAKMLAASVSEGLTTQGGSGSTLDLSGLEHGETVPEAAGATIVGRSGLAWAHAMLAVAVVSSVLLGYLLLRRPSSEAALAAPVAPPVNVAAAPPAVVANESSVPDPVAPDDAAPSSGLERESEPAAVQAARGMRARLRAAAEARAADTAMRRPSSSAREPLLIFETKTLVGTKKPREHEAQLVLAGGRIRVTADVESEYPFYDIPYDSVISISYSRGRDPMWNSPEGPAQVTRGGGTLGRLGITVARDWISLRTTTKDQFITMRFHELLVRRVLLALEERTGCRPDLLAQPADGR